MKKILAVLLCLSLLLGHALAFEGKNYPKYDASQAAAEAIGGSFAGESLRLDFDPSPECSNVADGLVQACFFAFDESEEFYLELYLMLPETIAAGETITESDMAGSGASITLYEVAPTYETLWYTGQMLGMAYPEGTNFKIHISAAEKKEGSLYVSGTLDAQLARFENDFPTQESIALSGLEFSFTLPLNGAVLPDGEAPSSGGSPAIIPAFTLPPDYAVI